MSESQIFLGPLETLLADGGVTAVHITETAVNFEKAGVMHASDIMRRAVICSPLTNPS